MNDKLQTIDAIFEQHSATFDGLTSEQWAVVLEAMSAAWNAGNQARPDCKIFDGDTSETLTPQEATLAHIFATAGDIPSDMPGICNWMDATYAQLQEVKA